jgi:hypothetical protein
MSLQTNGSGPQRHLGQQIRAVQIRAPHWFNPSIAHHEPPRFSGVHSFPDPCRAVLGPRKRWLALDRASSGVAPGGPARFLRLTRPGSPAAANQSVRARTSCYRKTSQRATAGSRSRQPLLPCATIRCYRRNPARWLTTMSSASSARRLSSPTRPAIRARRSPARLRSCAARAAPRVAVDGERPQQVGQDRRLL